MPTYRHDSNELRARSRHRLTLSEALWNKWAVK